MYPFARLVLVAATCLAPAVAQAKVHINVDLDRQTIHVEAKEQTFDWKVSSGKFGYETPNGKYGVLWMDKDHHSDTYDQAPMPNAIFFAPGYAIHGASTSSWGRPASHGCVRLPVAKSALLFDLVKAEGAEVNIIGYSPAVVDMHPKPKVSPAVAAASGASETKTRDGSIDTASGGQGGAPDDALFNSVY